MARPRLNSMNTGTYRDYGQTVPNRPGGSFRRLKTPSIFLAALLAVLIGLHVTAGIVTHSMPEPSYETMVVRRGDTLWDIARRVQPGTDPRKTIYEIKKLNHLQSVNLHPGQILLIPSAAVGRN
ncbi:MAG: LysM peptidoglycan-binding domain-containing protein [Firmicutes bacterium]|nr:LysM peptidoglycan-binding domain-containing protein [Bacillota bacterium]